MPGPEENRAGMPLPKVSETVEKPVTTPIPPLCLERQPFHIVDALRQALPELGRNIARAHYVLSVSQQYNAPHHEEAKERIRQLSENPDAVASHEPWWHEYGIVTHSENVVNVAQNNWPQLRDPCGDLAWAIGALASKEIDGLSLREPATMSPRHTQR